MKRLTDLGVSPLPWKAEDGHVWDFMNGRLFSGRYEESEMDAALTSRAPQLYDCLVEAVEERCRHCPYATTDIEGRFRCKKCTGCKVNEWRRVIEEVCDETKDN